MRTAFVTGGIRGIGEAISIALQQAGYRVAASYAANDEAAAAFSEKTGIPTFKFDIGDFAWTQEGVARVEKEVAPIDILVNNAGITRDAPLHRMTSEQWRDVLRVNLDSMFNVTRCVIEGMRARGFGRIINMSSINGQKGQAGQCNYSAAKAGVIGFTKALARENASKGITVNAVAPGYIATEMVRAVPKEILDKQIISQILVGRLGEAEEVARGVLFLADDDAGFVTGSTLVINGGHYITD